jgi:hypothetical protein
MAPKLRTQNGISDKVRTTVAPDVHPKYESYDYNLKNAHRKNPSSQIA